jgi:hypothetical protein
MTVYTKEFLSGSTNGKAIQILTVTSPGTLIHTAASASKDEIWIYAVNDDTLTRKLTIEWGGTTVADRLEVGVDAEAGFALIIPGLILISGLVVRAFADVASGVLIGGFINRIT